MMFEMILLVHTVVGNTYDRVQSVHTTDLTASSHNILVPTSTQIPQQFLKHFKITIGSDRTRAKSKALNPVEDYMVAGFIARS